MKPDEKMMSCNPYSWWILPWLHFTILSFINRIVALWGNALMKWEVYFRASGSESTQVALLLAQAGEFGFVLFGLAHMLGLINGEIYQLLLLVIALSMAATPLLVTLGHWLARAPASAPPAAAPPSQPVPALRNHIIVAGFGRFGNALAQILAKASVPYLVLEIDPRPADVVVKVSTATTNTDDILSPGSFSWHVLSSLTDDVRTFRDGTEVDGVEPIFGIALTTRRVSPPR